MWVKIKAFMEKNVIITLSIQKNFPNGKIKSKFMCNFAEKVVLIIRFRYS